MTEESLKNVNKLIFQRYLGHKNLIPGSGQWRMLTETGQKCWICSGSIFTLVFWTKSFAKDQSKLIEDF